MITTNRKCPYFKDKIVGSNWCTSVCKYCLKVDRDFDQHGRTDFIEITCELEEYSKGFEEIDEYELNEHGLKVWKHKTNKHLFLQKSYSWIDKITLIDESEGRQIITDFKYSTLDLYAWEPMTKEEYGRVKSKYKEIYE